MAKGIIEYKDEKDKLFAKLDKKTGKGYYNLSKDYSQYKFCEKILLSGFDHFPSGFYKNDGYGLTGAGKEFLEELFEKFGKKADLKIIKDGPFKIDSRGKNVKVTAPHSFLKKINEEKKLIRSQGAKRTQATIRRALAKQSAKHFGKFKNISEDYSPGHLASLLAANKLNAKLDANDRKALEKFIPEYLSLISGSLRSKKKLQLIASSIDAGRRVYLEKVLKEFKSKLKRKIQDEKKWQAFLSEYILIFRHTYGQVLDRSSISIIEGKYPDFMLVDPYSYVDIYEIKKPTTELLVLDRSRNNYYWSTEMSKAIAQVEKYLHKIQANSAVFKDELKTAKGIDVSIVKPRGYIIAGRRSDLKNEKLQMDFRILNASLKNIDVLLYDDLAEGLESFLTKLKKPRRSQKKASK